MGFKLESIKLENTNSTQEIISKYDISGINYGLSDDRTFCRCNKDENRCFCLTDPPSKHKDGGPSRCYSHGECGCYGD